MAYFLLRLEQQRREKIAEPGSPAIIILAFFRGFHPKRVETRSVVFALRQTRLSRRQTPGVCTPATGAIFLKKLLPLSSRQLE
jgi:hypothetical protein